MATWIIGDVHGHRGPLHRLLEAIEFDLASDRLVFVGDLVNGGCDSLGVLRDLAEIDPVVCLGNHDLHMLAVWSGARAMRDKDNFGDVLEAPDATELVDWLRGRSLAFRDEELDVLAVHAGVLPSWTAEQTVSLAAELEAVLQSDDYERFFEAMYGDKPNSWSPELEGDDRLRVLVNAFTRMRVIDESGRMEFEYKDRYDKIPPGWSAWFDCPRSTSDTLVVFGHWSALGLRRESRVVCIDSGVRWGGKLSALRAEDRHIVQVPAK